jgi:hypothetical protein
MNTNEKGNRGLAHVVTDVIEKGYFVFLPFTDTTHVDLIIADKTMKTYRVQVKYSAVNKKGLIKASTSNVVDRKRVPVNLSHVDLWAIYCPDTKEVYYISTKELIGKSTGMELRVIPSKHPSSTSHLAKDYLSIENALK